MEDKIGCKQHKSIDPSCLASTLKAGGPIMVQGIFPWQTLGPFIPPEHRLNAADLLKGRQEE